MLIRRTVLANTTDSFPVNGRYFSLIQGSNCRVNLLKSGSRIFSSEVYEGMGSKFENIDSVEIESKIEQVVEYWLGESEYRYTPPSLRSLNLKMSQVAVISGVSRVVTANHKRLRTKLTFKDDCFVGGDDMTVVGDGVSNAVPVKAGETFIVDSSGTINAFVSTNAINEFLLTDNLVISQVHSGIVPNRTNWNELTSLVTSYIDVDVPEHLVGQEVQMSFYATGGTSSTNAVRFVAGNIENNANSTVDLNGITTMGLNVSWSPKLRLPYRKTRLFIYNSGWTNLTVQWCQFSHEDWDKIHTVIDVVEETL